MTPNLSIRLIRSLDTFARFELMLQYLRTFVVEWFDQNPLGQVGVITMKNRISEVLVPMGGRSSYKSVCLMI